MAKKRNKFSSDHAHLSGLSNLLGEFGPAFEAPRDQQRPRSQAESVIDKFGGARHLKEALELAGYPLNLATIYKWTYSRKGKNRGCDGFIPVAAWPAILDAARLAGVMLDAQQFDPRRAAIVQNVKTPLYIYKMKRERRRRAGF